MFYLYRQDNKIKAISAMSTKLLYVVTSLICFSSGIDAKREYSPPENCGLYLAPSSIPGAGLGMYSGSVAYTKGSIISDSDLMIPTWDLDYHNGNDVYYHLWDEYTWSSSMFPGMQDDVEDIKAMSIVSSGFGAAINCMMPLVNVGDEKWDDDHAFKLTNSGIPQGSPGAGAFTPMTGRRFRATEEIQPFMELYASYGESYFEGRKVYDFVPFDWHYERADVLISSFIGNITSWQSKRDGYIRSKNFEVEMWDFIVQLRKIWDKSRTLFALPGKNSTRVDDLIGLMEFGGSSYQDYNDTIKNQEWMNEYGQCMDNIRDGVSKIPHAGRGAFANRFIPNGGLVTPAPLIHLPNRSSLTIYEHMITPAGKWRRDRDHPAHDQLLLNYCFGHRESSLLLCPYGYLNFLINHDHKNPNTKVVWTEKKRMRHPEWFEMPVTDWGKEFHSGLALDFVALRDIKEGEEITIDYGIEWETAWQEHVQNYGEPRRGYRQAFELNRISDLRIPTIYEPIEDQFEGVITFCRFYYFPEDYEERFKPYKFGTDEDEDQEADWHYTCRVLMRHNNDKYTVEIFHRQKWFDNGAIYETHQDTPLYILFDVPRDAMFFRDRVYHRDHHQPFSFRHDMRLPDEIFPDVWKHRENQTKTLMT